MSGYLGQAPGQGQIQYFTFTATAGQTVFSGVDDNKYVLNYATGFCDVFLNGRRLTPTSDYTATDGSTITLQSAASLNDVIFVASASVFNTADWVTNAVNYVYTATAGQTTFTGGDDNANTLSYVNGTILVSVNGINLPQSDFTATNGSTVILNSGVNLGDVVQIFSLRTMAVVNFLPLGGGTLSGSLTVGNSSVNTYITAGNIALNGSTLLIGNSTSNVVITGTTLTISNSSSNVSISPGPATINAISTNTFTVGTATYFTANGNVGINTNAPNFIGVNQNSRILSIVGNAGGSHYYRGCLELRNPGEGMVDAGDIYFVSGSLSNAAYASIGGGATGSGGASGYGSALYFNTKTDNGSSALRMIIDSNGNIGIGNNSPTNKLSVNGNTYFGNSITFSDSTQMTTSASLGMRNRIINGDMKIWQRGTTFTPAYTGNNAYTADRWFVSRNYSTANVTVTQQTTSVTGIAKYGLRIQRTVNDANTAGNFYVIQHIENKNMQDLAGQTVTLSCWVKVGANISNSNISCSLISGTGTDENYYAGYTGGSSVCSFNIPSSTTSYTKFTATGTVPSNSNELCVFFSYYPSGTAGANDWFELTDVQVEVGNVSTPFERRLYPAELALCQRYCYTVTATTTNARMAISGNYGGTSAFPTVILPVSFRPVAPTVSYSSLSHFATEQLAGGQQTPTGIGLNSYSDNSITFQVTAGSSFTGPVNLLGISTSARIYCSAEL